MTRSLWGSLAANLKHLIEFHRLSFPLYAILLILLYASFRGGIKYSLSMSHAMYHVRRRRYRVD